MNYNFLIRIINVYASYGIADSATFHHNLGEYNTKNCI